MRQASAMDRDVRLRQGLRRRQADAADALALPALRHKDAARPMALLQRQKGQDVRAFGEKEGQDRRSPDLQGQGDVRKGKPRILQDPGDQGPHDGRLFLHGGQRGADGIDDGPQGFLEGGPGKDRALLPFQMEDRGALPLQEGAVRVRGLQGEVAGFVELPGLPARRRPPRFGRRDRKEGDEFPLLGAAFQGEGREGEGLPRVLQDGDGRAGPFHGKQKRGEGLSEHPQASR